MIAGVQKIGLASDHAGYYIKIAVRDFLAMWAPEVELIDYGTDSGSESCDYPDFAHKLGDALDRGEVDMGVGVCGSGRGSRWHSISTGPFVRDSPGCRRSHR